MAQRLDRRVLFLWWAIGALCTIGVAAAAVVVAQLGRPPRAWLALVAGLAGTLAAVIPPLRYRRWRHELRARDALLSKGALFFVQLLIPFDRIQFVETRQGPLDRLFGLSQVVLYTAAGRAGRAPGLSPAQAEALRERRRRSRPWSHPKTNASVRSFSPGRPPRPPPETMCPTSPACRRATSCLRV